MFEESSQKLRDAKIIPVVKIDDEQKALSLAEALLLGGMSVIEITFRTTDGEEGFKKIAACIKKIRDEVPKMYVGAGTVINAALAQRAVEAGAQFIVSPGFNPLTVDWCINKNIPVYPGVNTPSLVEQALEKGLSVLKFFPSEVCGGTKMLDALKGPFPGVKFIPTGGINQKNVLNYFKCKNTLAVGGSWMVNENLINECKWDKITRLAKKAVLALS